MDYGLNWVRFHATGRTRMEVVHTHARARLAPQFQRRVGSLTRSRVSSQAYNYMDNMEELRTSCQVK